MLPFGRPSLFLLFIGVFVLPASGQSCTQLKCTKRGEVCIVADDNQEECTCREAECPFTSEEVCGSDSITYKSRCDLDKTACMLGVNITEAHMGKCGESPILVSNSHRTQQTLTLGKRGKIRCDFTGKYVQVRWQKIAPNGKCLSIGFPRVAYRLNTLRFRRVHKQDAGTYRCIASTGSRNTAKATVKVSVEEPEPMDKTVESYTVCHSVKLVGTGSNYSTRWYFDAKESWKCLPFLYRGSGGNRNNFKNKQTCLKKCAHAAGDVCDLPKDPGPCMAYLQRWHYNTTSGKCDKFIYGGCLGNANNFKTKEECNQRCSASQVCQLKPAAGICLGYFPSYFFNQTSGQCEKFIYGGCLGNSNRFQTMELCQKKCNRQAKVLQDVGEKPGVCPWRRMILIFCGERKDLCESDWSCEGNHKCCFDGCRQTCVKPVLIQKKPGKCPKLTRDECPEDRTGRCAVDGDCPGSRKCCYNGCHSDCVVPERVRRLKPGVCPVEGAIDKKLCKHTKNECKADEDCFGRLKCCFNGCFNECVPLRRSRPKPGKCPVLDGDPPANCPSRTDKCADDSECPGKNKCCFTGCVNKCIAPPPKEKPGECPLADFIPPEMCEDTTDKCKEDDDCPGRAKCCSTGCLSECIVPPIREKPGECPVVDFLPLEQCEDTTDKCSIDDDCPGRGKCCGTGCIKECVIPPLTLPPKKGQCPKPWKGLNGICDRRGDECSDDSSCPGNGKCCDNGCQKECIDPVPVDKPGTCPKPWKGLDGICDRRGDMCDVDIKCRRDEKCCFNGCQRDCVKPAEQTSDKEGRCPKPWKEQPCDRRGDMCSTDKDCYGKSKCCFNGCQKDCSQSVNMTTCQEKRQKALDLITAEEPIVGVPVPKCKPDGSFEDEQCHELYCWCVDSKSGVKIPGTSVRGHASCFAREKPGKCPRPWKGKKGICDYRGDRCLKDDECPGDHRCCFNGCQNDCVPPVGTKLCDKHNKEMTSDAEGGSPLIGAFIPSCKLDGDYEEVQCHASPDYCWCVDKFGNEKPGTRVKGKPACDAKGNQRGAGKAGTCPEPWKGSTGFCDKMGDECGMDFSCPGEEKCCFSGCQRLCVNTTETHKKGGTKPGKCPKPWLGQEGLCNRRGDMCQSDTDCGDEQICCSNGCQKECVAPGLSTCQLRYEQSFMFPRLGRFVPQCKEDGRFAETQCHASTGHCWCVDHYGAEQLGTRTKGRKNCTEPDPCQETNCDFYGECVPSNDRTSVECKCNVACYLVHDPVCGTDGKTYGNECQMKSTACLHKRDIKVAYKGECAEVDACETIDCGYYADCLIVNGTGQCACPRLDCSEDSAHVCGSDGTVYKDECHLMSESCKKGKLITPALPEFCVGPSDPCDNVNCGHPLQKCKVVDGKAVCDCSHILCTREFDPVCGTDGKDYSTECMLRFLSCEAGNIVSVDYKGKCNIGLLLAADKVDPCDKVNCSKPHSICVDANGTAQCQCPFAMTLEYFPVCGSDGVVYPNPSSLNIASCNSDGAIFKVQDGECPSFADPCAVSRCSHKRHRCVVKNSTAVCVCNLACTLEYDPVCASNNITYSNRCSMEVAECELGKRLRVVHKGECGSIEVCPVPWKGKGGICDRRGDMCQTDADCLRGKCCFNGCQNDCIKSIGHLDCGVKCDPNAQCIEFVFGGRRCVCNPGFHGDGKTCSVDLCSTKKCHQYATCAVKDGMAVCVCPLICPAIYLPVCGSDGKVYGNDCQLRVESCTQQKDIFVASKEDCKPDPCEKSKCSHPLHKCIKTSHGASCRCLPAPCTREFIPVCGSDGKSYPNKCVMTQTGCERSQNITKVHDGECAKETNPCDATELCTHPFHQCVERENNAVCVCPMVVPLIWSPVCGSDGHTYSNSWALKSATCLANRIVKEVNKGQCPSLTDPCDFSLCSHKKHFCRVVKGNAECVCREICPLILQPVCGSDGVSYPNLCSLEVESCKTGKSIEVISEGRCDLCAEKKCSHPLHYCKVVNYVATCVCTEICPFLWSPVCGSDGKTYPNNCSLNVAACKTGQDLKIKHAGECSTRPGECPVLNPTPVCRSITGCDKDEKCPLGERCCLQGDCTRKCVKAEIPPPPPPELLTCPLINPTPQCARPAEPNCFTGGPKCGAGKACCLDQDCIHKCVSPALSDGTRPGECPVLNPTPVCRSITGCDKDERCPLGERCCLQRDCTRKCVKAAAPPPPQLLRHIRPVSIPTAMCVPPCHPFGNCVKNDAGKYECSCERPCTREYNPVCGTDGKTYSTKCMMKLLVCEQGSDVTVNYRGECKKESCPFEISPCHYPRPVCIMAKGKPTCRCRNICPALLDPVCGSDGVTYDNMCLLERRACLVENSGAPSGSLRYLGNGECTAAQICSLPPEVGRCRAALRRYFFNATSRQCELFKYGGCDGNTNRFDTEEKCQDFCGSLTVCQLDPCPDPYAICTESSAGHRKCACPEACTKDYSPVCGSDGNTYSNECHMQGTACEQGVMIKVKSEGECDNHPGRCPPVDPRPCPEELSDKCFDDASCEPNEKCCYDGCEKACMKPFLRPPPQSFSQRLLSLRESAPDSPSCKPCSKFPNSCEPDRSVEGNCTPVCGTDGREYSSYCQLLAEACKPENAGVLKLRHRGPCVCDLPLAAGPCLGYMPRFFYNSTSKQCEHFVYGGCRGNGNRFHTIEQCENKCISPCKNFNCSSPHAECEVKHGRPVCECRMACTADYRPVCGTDGRTYGNRCALESVACTEERPWLKRRYLGECSNSPNPCTLSLCKRKRHKCVVKDNTAVCVCKPCRKNSYKPVCASNGRDYINECLMEVAACESGEDLTVVHPGKCNICDLPPEPGMCEAYMPNYFFNATSKRCERFIYGGCGGNGNRFTSVKDCQKKCQVCDLPPEPGMCEAYMPQYFFNATSKRCERFIYGGCGGNGNRFTSVKDCQKKCQGEPPSSDDPCQTKKCDYHGICRVTEDGLSTCECSTVCPASYKPVCGSDGKIYSNQCLLKVHACRNRLDIRVVGGPKKCSAKKVRCKACPARSDLLSHFCNNDFVIAGNLTGIQGAEEGYWSTITVSVTDVFKGPSPPQDRMLKIAFTENLNRCYCKEFDLSRSKSNGELIIGGLVSKDSGGMFLDKWSYAHHSTPHLLRKVREITKKERCGTFEELD